MTVADDVLAVLMAEQDLSYRDFHSGLLPNIPKELIIGVRVPKLRAIARELAKDNRKRLVFLQELPHKYYDENTLHGLLIACCKDYRQVIEELKIFLPYIDNWATCDLTNPKIFLKHQTELLPEIRQWLKSNHTYCKRFAINMLMNYYLGDAFADEYVEWVIPLSDAEDYYLKMGIAWYFATALAKQYSAVLPYIEAKRLERWTHNKGIQKALESKRITTEQKIYLRTLKIV